jgi:hypothetical protein
MPVILATQEAEIRRIVVGSQPGQIVHEILSSQTLPPKKAGGVAQGVGPVFKLQYCKKKKKKRWFFEYLSLKTLISVTAEWNTRHINFIIYV